MPNEKAPSGKSKLKKEDADKSKYKKSKYKNIPTALAQSHIDDLDEIAKAEEMTRSEVVRRAIEHFIASYKADKLDERQSILLKQMKAMEKDIRGLLVKAIRVSGQCLYFETLPYTMGTPKQKLTDKGFQTLFDKSANFGYQIAKSKGQPGKVPSDEVPASAETTETEGQG